MKTDTKHLKLRGNVWWYHRNIPSKARHLYDGKSTLSESLGTGDIREARVKRDILNGRLMERTETAANPDRFRFNELLKEMSETPEEVRDDIYHPDLTYRSDVDEVYVEAYTAVNRGQTRSDKYTCTLKEALQLWQRKYGETKSKDTADKLKQAVSKYLSWLRMQDIQLRDISKRQVHEYVEYLGKQYASTTVFGFVSRLRSVWKYASSLGEADGVCPFDGHDTQGRSAKEKKQPFTKEQMEVIRGYAEAQRPAMSLLVLLGIYTGCRISELCNLKVANVIEEDGVVALIIERGKTSAASRTIPVAEHLVEDVKALAADREPDEALLGLDSKTASREFSRFKTAEVSDNSAQCFHSLRVMFATALQRAGVAEHEAAALLGHSRGTTMTYGYYSKGYLLPQLNSALERAVPFL